MKPAPLPPAAACLVRLSAALAAGAEDAAATELRAAAGVAAPEQVDEAILQSCLFLGFPAALEAAAAWREIREGTPADEDPLSAPERAPERAERGARLCRAVYGHAYETLRRNVAHASPALDRLMVETGYGAILGRPGLEFAWRELCLVAVLAVQGRDRQLHSHLRGALRAGASAAWTEEALEIGLARAGEETGERLRRLWAEVRERGAKRAGADVGAGGEKEPGARPPGESSRESERKPDVH